MNRSADAAATALDDASHRTAAGGIWQAGVDAVRGDVAVAARVAIDATALTIADVVIPRHDFDRLLVVGGGKAAAAMAAGLVRVLAGRVPIRGRINVPEGTSEGDDIGGIEVHAVRPAGVNEPTEMAVRCTAAMLTDVATASSRDLCIVLLSGGGSALLVAPREGVSLADKLAVTRYLSAAGASINQLNAVRSKLSRVKAGGLLKACRAGRLITLVLSDVIGDPLDVIASGPTVTAREIAVSDSPVADSPVADTVATARSVLRRFDPERSLPASIYRIVDSGTGATADVSDGRPPRNDIVIVGNNSVAIEAAAEKAERTGWTVRRQFAEEDEGTAEEVGKRLADQAIAMLHPPDSEVTDAAVADNVAEANCLIAGGEPVVRLAPAAIRGRGGRNQQVVLAALIALARDPRFTHSDRFRLVLLSAGTDGEDGPTDAAGAILDETVWRAYENQRLDPVDYLSRNDAYTFFSLTGGLLMTGATGTNVCDLRVVTVKASTDRTATTATDAGPETTERTP